MSVYEITPKKQEGVWTWLVNNALLAKQREQEGIDWLICLW